MSIPFAKTLGFVEREESGDGRIVLAVTSILVALGLVWMTQSSTHVFAVSEEGRLLAAGASSPIQAPVAGIVLENKIQLGASVTAGDVLVILDSRAELIHKKQEEVRIAGLEETISTMERTIEAERDLTIAAAKVSSSRVNSASARARAAYSVASVAKQHADTVQRLNEGAMISGLDALHSNQELLAQRGQAFISAAEAAEASADLTRMRKEGNVRALNLGRELSEARAQHAGAVAALSAIDWEVARRSLRAPISGRVADTSSFPKGAVVGPTQTLATIVPQAPPVWVAYFSPRDAVGRIKEGQTARVRLDAFPWTAYGVLPCTVRRVGSEPREQRIRVELSIDSPNSSIPLSHGMTGSTDVEVETVTPLRLFFLLSGHALQSAPPPPANSSTTSAPPTGDLAHSP